MPGRVESLKMGCTSQKVQMQFQPPPPVSHDAVSLASLTPSDILKLPLSRAALHTPWTELLSQGHGRCQPADVKRPAHAPWQRPAARDAFQQPLTPMRRRPCCSPCWAAAAAAAARSMRSCLWAACSAPVAPQQWSKPLGRGVLPQHFCSNHLPPPQTSAYWHPPPPGLPACHFRPRLPPAPCRPARAPWMQGGAWRAQGGRVSAGRDCRCAAGPAGCLPGGGAERHRGRRLHRQAGQQHR